VAIKGPRPLLFFLHKLTHLDKSSSVVEQVYVFKGIPFFKGKVLILFLLEEVSVGG